jgi:hypothetical protein
MHPSHAELTLYQPPKSQGFGQITTPRDPLAAWQSLETFIKDHAIANEWLATGLSIDTRPEFWTPESLSRAVAILTDLEGPPNLTPGGTYKSHPSDTLGWLEKPDQRRPLSLRTLMAVIDIASRLPKSKIRWCDPIRLGFGFDFFWRGRSGSQAPPVRAVRTLHQASDWGPGNPYSSLGFLVTGSLFVQPFFLFPFAWGTATLNELLAEIAPKLPIKLRPNYFRRAIVNQRGDAFKLTRPEAKTTA